MITDPAMECSNPACRIVTTNLYFVSPTTGRRTNTPLCRNCFERAHSAAVREAQERGTHHNDGMVVRTKVSEA